jgi:hypothetical protein
MSLTMLIALVVIFAVLLAGRRARGGPRVTQITTRREKDEPEDRDDA